MKYYLTEEQLEILHNLKSRTETTSDDLKEVCSKENPDINIGFKMGTIYSNVRAQFIDMWDLVDSIKQQKLDESKN